MKTKVFFLLLIFLFVPFGFILAQNPIVDQATGLPTGIIEQVSVKVLPKVPNPGESVTISVESFSTNLDKAKFVWRANGSVVLDGNGERNFSFSAPESGKSVVISLVIQKEGGGTIERSFTFSPADVDILYEANTYTPPFYKGKALFTNESEVRFVAMPNFVENGKTLNPNSLVYKWSVNGTVNETGSGYGKRIFRVKGSLIERPFIIDVEVSAVNSALIAKNSLYLKSTSPDLVIYEDNPILGVVFENAVFGQFILDRPEIEFQAIPFYFSSTQKDSSLLDYQWTMNSEKIEQGSKSSSIRFRNETGEDGIANIGLQVEHFADILQVAGTGVELNFKKYNAVSENDVEF